jgi:hypothetical protein
MGDVVQESEPTTAALPAVQRRRLPVVGVLITVLTAAALIGITGRLLRARQNLVASIAAKDVQMFLPFSNDLQERVEARTTWDRLYGKLEQNRQRDPKQFVTTGFELEKFISTKISADDPRRMQVLLDIAARADSVPDAVDAYWDLFNPAWRRQLEPLYPSYTAALQARFADASSSSLERLAHLSEVLESLGQTDLQVQTLRKIRTQSTVNFITLDSMKQLLQKLPPADPDRAALQGDIEKYTRFHEQLLAFGSWYEKFEAARQKGDLAAAEKVRQQAPAGPPNAFIASADAHLAQLKARLGQFDQATQLREAVAGYHLVDADFDECANIARELAPAEARDSKRPRTAPVAPPDGLNVRIQQWRGAMLAGRPDDAPDLKPLFHGNEFAVLRQYTDEERNILTGQTAKLTPQAKFELRDTSLPPELGSSPRAWFAAIDLTPIGKSIEKNPKPHAELWFDDDHVLVIINSPYPRDPAAKPSKQRDATMTGETHVDLLFNPDRWIDSYTYVSVNEADNVFDARITNADPPPRRRYVADTKLNLDAKVASTQTDKTWQQRVLLPRPLLIPPGLPAVRFNLRLVRNVTERGQRIVQIYSWHPGSSGLPDFRADQTGFLLLPKP